MTAHLRHPPAVRYRLPRSPVPAALALACLLPGAVLLAAWLAYGAGPLDWWQPVAACGLWLAAALAALHFWRGQFVGSIRWDGQTWALQPAAGHKNQWLALERAPEVLLDLQTLLWLRAAPQGRRPLWLLAARAAQPLHWMALRRAVYSRARPGADPAADPTGNSKNATAVGRRGA